MRVGSATILQPAERQWNPSATLPAELAQAANEGNDGGKDGAPACETVGVMRDAFALHSDPERPMDEVRFDPRNPHGHSSALAVSLLVNARAERTLS